MLRPTLVEDHTYLAACPFGVQYLHHEVPIRVSVTETCKPDLREASGKQPILFFGRVTLAYGEQRRRHFYQVERPLGCGTVSPETLQGIGHAPAVVLVFHRLLEEDHPLDLDELGPKEPRVVTAVATGFGLA